MVPKMPPRIITRDLSDDLREVTGVGSGDNPLSYLYAASARNITTFLGHARVCDIIKENEGLGAICVTIL
jgi:hypothetical protein